MQEKSAKQVAFEEPTSIHKRNLTFIIVHAHSGSLTLATCQAHIGNK